jgi:hypothetical protein
MKSTYRKTVFLYVLLSAAGTFGSLISTDLISNADAQPRENPCSVLVQERLNAREAFSGLIAGGDPSAIVGSIESNLGAHVDCATPELQPPE